MATSANGGPRGRRAADQAQHRDTLRVQLPMLGAVSLPAADQLAFLGGIGVLVGLGLVEWPVGALLGAGHLLAASRNHKILADFGNALEEA
jgi:hypothetical protein